MSVPRREHSTSWEDGQMVGLVCNGKQVDQVLNLDHEQPDTCSRCGDKVRLVWNVYVDTIGEPPPPPHRPAVPNTGTEV